MPPGAGPPNRSKRTSTRFVSALSLCTSSTLLLEKYFTPAPTAPATEALRRLLPKILGAAADGAGNLGIELARAVKVWKPPLTAPDTVTLSTLLPLKNCSLRSGPCPPMH